MAISCKKCNVDLEERDVARCATCKAVTHIECSRTFKNKNIDALLVDKITKIGFKFICNNCTGSFENNSQILMDINSVLSKLNCKVDSLTDKISDMDSVNEAKFDNLNEKISEIKNSFSDLQDKSYEIVNKNNCNSYASILKKSKKSTIIVTSKDDSDNDFDLRGKITTCIDPRTEKVANLRIDKNNRAIIESLESNTDKFLSNVKDKLGDDFNVTVFNKSNPRLKIVNFPNTKNLSGEDILLSILSQNSDIIVNESEVKLVKLVENKHRDLTNIIIECPRDLHKVFIAQKFVTVEWRRYRVYDNLNLNVCYKCSRFGHIEKNCDKELCCSTCAGSHKSQDCKSTSRKCINCEEANKNFKSKIDIHHASWDMKCTSKLKRIKFVQNIVKRNQ